MDVLLRPGVSSVNYMPHSDETPQLKIREQSGESICPIVFASVAYPRWFTPLYWTVGFSGKVAESNGMGKEQKDSAQLRS